MIKQVSNEIYEQQFALALSTNLKFVVSRILWVILAGICLFILQLLIKNHFFLLHSEILKGISLVLMLGIVFFAVLQRQHKPENDFADQDLFIKNPNPMWIFDFKSLQFIDVNEAALFAYGYTREEFLSMTFTDLCVQEERSGFKAHLTQNERDYKLPGRNTIQCKDGTLIKVDLSCFNISHKNYKAGLILSNHAIEQDEQKKYIDNDFVRQINDRIAGLVLANKELEVRNREIYATNDELINLSNLLQDANKKLAAQSALAVKQRSDQLSRIIEQVSEGIWSFDLTGEGEHFVNTATAKLFEVSKEKIMDSPNFWLGLIRPEEKAGILQKLKELETCNEIEITYNITTARDNKTIWQRINIVRNEHGEAVSIECVGREAI